MDVITIFALSSGAGRAGIAVVRISGPASGALLDRLTGRPRPPARRAVHGAIADPADGAPLDRCVYVWNPGPASFTGEDLVELQLHGSPAVVAGVLSALAAMPGLRPAEPGEFTRRAFDNGKLDLAEVEGLADLIAAETEAQRRQALRQMDGVLSRRVEAWRDRLTRLLAHFEAAIDFPEEDEALATALPALRQELSAAAAELSGELADRRRGERLRDGLKVAVVGAPNVGKSSLVNALADRDVAIVADFAGTTRDVVAVHLDLTGFPVTVLDTAGLRAIDADARGAEAVEAEGIRRAQAAAAGADLRLVVFDAVSEPPFDAAMLEQLGEGEALVVLNKADLAGERSLPDRVGGHPALAMSAKTGAGLPALVEALAGSARGLLGTRGEAPLVTRARHRAALEEARAALLRAAAAALPELSAEDLRLALRALGRITGRIDVEDLLELVFREFCIGK